MNYNKKCYVLGKTAYLHQFYQYVPIKVTCLQKSLLTKDSNKELSTHAHWHQIGSRWRRGGAGGEDIDSRRRQCACSESCVSVFKLYKHCIRKLSLITTPTTKSLAHNFTTRKEFLYGILRICALGHESLDAHSTALTSYVIKRYILLGILLPL